MGNDAHGHESDGRMEPSAAAPATPSTGGRGTRDVRTDARPGELERTPSERDRTERADPMKDGESAPWLELLLPGLEQGPERQRARQLLEQLSTWVLPPRNDGPGHRARVTTAPPSDGGSARGVEPSADMLARARSLLERADRDEVFDQIESALAAILGSALGPGTFASYVRAVDDERAAWQALDRFRTRVDDLPAAAATGETVRTVAGRLLEWLVRDAEGSADRTRRARRWPLRLEWAFDGPVAGLRHWQATFAARDFGRRSIVERASALVDGIELCLESSDPTRALALARAGERERALEPRLVQLAGWCEVLAGDVSIGQGWLAEDERRIDRLPAALIAAGRRSPWLARALWAGRPVRSIDGSAGGCGDGSNGDGSNGDDSSADGCSRGLVRIELVDGLPRGARRVVVALQREETGELGSVHEAWNPRVSDATRAAAPHDVTDWDATVAEPSDDARSDSNRRFETRQHRCEPSGVDRNPSDGARSRAQRPWPASIGIPRELLEEALMCGAPRVRLLDPDEYGPTDEFPRAVAAVPLPAEGPRGAIWLEFDHRLVPDDATLRRIAEDLLRPWWEAAESEHLPPSTRAHDRDGTYDPFAAEVDGTAVDPPTARRQNRGPLPAEPSSERSRGSQQAGRTGALRTATPEPVRRKSVTETPVARESVTRTPEIRTPVTRESVTRTPVTRTSVAPDSATRSSAPRHPEALDANTTAATNVAAADPLASAVRALVAQSSLRRSQRPWWVFVARPIGAGPLADGSSRPRGDQGVAMAGGGFRVVASDGGNPPRRSSATLLPPFEPGGEYALDAVGRCFRSGAPSLVEHLSVGEGVDPVSRSGCYVPLRASRGAPWPHGDVVAVLAVESARRRDFRASFVHDLLCANSDGADALLLADAAAWHAERFGEPLVPEAFLLDVPERSLHEPDRAHDDARFVVAAAARARRDGALGVIGPVGSGRTHLARCVHFLAGCDGPIVEVRADREPERLAERLLHGRGTLLVRDLHDAPESLAEAVRRGDRPSGPLVLWTESTPSRAGDVVVGGTFGSAVDRTVISKAIGTVTSTVDRAVTGTVERMVNSKGNGGPKEGRGGGELDGGPLVLAPLERAGGRIGEIAALLVTRAARGLDREPGPELDDGARAALWRGTWSGAWCGGLADLDRLAHALVRERRRGRVGATVLESVAARLSIALPPRLPSRRPCTALLEDAVRATALANGRANQRRAALYLGWDRDTVRARLREADLG